MAKFPFISSRLFYICALLLIATLAADLAASANSSPQADEPQALAQGAAVERGLASGQTHFYNISLVAGDYLNIRISQSGVMVEPKLFAPDKTQITDFFIANSHRGPIAVSTTVQVTGIYRLEIKAQGKDAAKGIYKIEAVEIRPTTTEDSLRLAAERAFQEGERLKQKPTVKERMRGIAKLEEAALYWQEIGDSKGETRALTAIGFGYEYGGELQTALSYYERAIQIAQSDGNRLGEANLHLSMARLRFAFGYKQKALDSLNQSARLYRDSSARYGEALALASMGTAYFSLGEAQRALEYHERALTTISSMGDWGNECISRNHIGSIYAFMGETQKALEYYNQALALARKLQNKQIEANTLKNLGNIQLSLGNKQQALDYYSEGLRLAEVGGFRISEGILHRSIGEVAFLMGDVEKALNSLDKSLLQFQSTKFRAEEANTLYSLARVNFSRGDLTQARRQIESALDIKESLRAPVVAPNLRIASVASLQNSYSLYINLLMKLHRKNPEEGHDRRALEASEQARARGLLELLVESGAEIRQGVSSELLVLERSLQQRLNAKAAARTRLNDNAQAASFDKEISELTSRYREVQAQIRSSSPRYAALTQPRPLSAARIQQLLDQESVLLEFFLGEEGSSLWVVTPKTISSYQLPPRVEIESVARRVYEMLTARQPKAGLTQSEQAARIDQADARLQTEAGHLGRILFGQIAGPLCQELKGKRLLIVASGALEYLPFASLPIPTGDNSYKPLIAEHEIVNLPSATVLSVLRQEAVSRHTPSKTVAVFADPVFEPNDPRVLLAMKRKSDVRQMAINARSASLSQKPDSDLSQALKKMGRSTDRAGLSRLPFSREEAEAISSLVPSSSLLRATDFEASNAKAMSGELSDYRIIHFATHGLLNSQHPELSGLVFSLIDEQGKAQDGFLRMHEIYNLRLSADMVVLSACQTALGKEFRGEGLVGLTRGFMYAGAQRVVASLWQVDDLATAELMERFYRGMLKEGLPPASALRAAQMDLMKEKRWSSPFFWAGFVIQGEWK